MMLRLRPKCIQTVAVCAGIYVAHSLVIKETKHTCKGDSKGNSDSNGSDCKPTCPIKKPLPSRDAHLENLRRNNFDILVIGGGATGTGCALDATTRGLTTALVEADDFASGTSSRSTKLVHGGVRYLQKAVMRLDISQYKLVKEALRERAHVLEVAPHLAKPLPIILPMYSYWEIVYYWMGIKMYDLVAGRRVLQKSHFLSKSKALAAFPMLKESGLKGGIVYYDGSMNDARLALSLALTAAHYGATVLNHVRVIELRHEETEYGMAVRGARVRDELTEEEFDVCAKCVINATGPFTDCVRKMDDPQIKPICAPSSGVHIVLPGFFSPANMGLLDPSTSDDRVIFFLPWLNHTLAGTTDTQSRITPSPSPTEEEILFILKELKSYICPDIEIRRGDVLSAWCGIRPLVRDPGKADTAEIARTHVVEVSKSHLITIAGGKWTTYRAMAEEAVTRAVDTCQLICKNGNTCRTENLKLEGAQCWTPNMFMRLVQNYGLDAGVAKHLTDSYGDRAVCVAELAEPTGSRWPIVGNKLHPDYPFINAEVHYAMKEYACTAIDVIARRLNLAFLNAQVAFESLPDIVDIMATELEWSPMQKQEQYEEACEFLQEQMAMPKPDASTEKGFNTHGLNPSEIAFYTSRFKGMDGEKYGYVTVTDVKQNLKRHGDDIPTNELCGILTCIDPKRNGQLELDEYLQLMRGIKHGVDKKPKKCSSGNEDKKDIRFVTTDHSCGDV